MSRDRARTIAVWAASLLLGAATVNHLAAIGPPYFKPPTTIVDHFGSRPGEARDALLLLWQAREVIPRGAEVACFRPRDGQQWNDTASYLTAVGMMPEHVVLPPFTAAHEVSGDQLIEYVIAVKEPFTHPEYKPVNGFPQGWVYQRIRQ